MTDSLAALAASVETHADELRTRAARLAAAAGATPWQSFGAQRFRDEVDELARHLRAAATRVDAAAATVRKHAATVVQLQRGIRTLERAGERVFDWLDGR